jgi:hypothetical protein
LVFTQPAHLSSEAGRPGIDVNPSLARAAYVRRELEADAKRASG